MDINEELFLHRQAIIEAATEAVLGKDYYNYCCDSWSCTEMCMEDILYKLPFGKKYVKKYRKIMVQKNKELEERRKKEMKKYEFHIGDYVETKDGKIGYIENITKDPDGTVDIIVVNLATCSRTYKIYNCRKICNTNTNYSSSNTEDVFNRIGRYDFTKSQKQNKIEQLHICNSADFTKRNIENIGNKVNEIIDYINSKND